MGETESEYVRGSFRSVKSETESEKTGPWGRSVSLSRPLGILTDRRVNPGYSPTNRTN